MKQRHTWLAVLVFAASCLRPSEERAERDLEVGIATESGVSVVVEDGLAAVRALDANKLTLWGSAPAFAVELALQSAQTDPGNPGGLSIDVEVQNCLTDAELRIVEPADATLTALEASDVPTRKTWRLRAPSGRARIVLTPPHLEDMAPFRFALLSDVQEAIDDVSDVFERINEQSGLSFLLGAGDLTERGERGELERFQRELLRLRIPYFTTLGNHELGTSPELFHEYFGRGNLQFRFHGVYFTLLDSASATLDPIVYGWLDDWLTRARADVNIVAMQIPPIDPIGVRNGSWASRSEAAKLLGRLAEGHVDMTLYGHVHSYYSFDNAGIPAFISGGGGAIPERFDRIGRHFMVFEVDAKDGVTSRQVIKVD